MKKHVFPQFGASKIQPIIEGIYLLGGRASKEDLSAEINNAVGTINNHLSLLVELKLIKHNKDYLTLTEEGKELAISFKTNNYEHIEAIFYKIKIFSMVVTIGEELLSVYPDSDHYTLGKAICERLNKEGTSDFYKRLGRSVIDIINLFTNNKYYNENNPRPNEVIRPHITSGKIIEKLHSANENNVINCGSHKLSWREVEGYNTMVDLKLLRKISANKYALTEKGKLLRDANEKKQSKLFRDYLLNDEHLRKVIMHIPKLNEINNLTLGNALAKEFNASWGDSTKEGFGKKLRNWLSFAELLNGSHGDYQPSKLLIQYSDGKQAIIKDYNEIISDGIRKEKSTRIKKEPAQQPQIETEIVQINEYSYEKELLRLKALTLFAFQDPDDDEIPKMIDSCLLGLLQNKDVKKNKLLYMLLSNIEKRIKLALETHDQSDKHTVIEDLKVLYFSYF